MNILSARSVLLVQPACFRNNEQTSGNNRFQRPAASQPVQEAALAEFNGLVSALQGHGVHTVVVADKAEHDTPDSLFPNNWLSTHEDGTAVLYPMYAPNRRRERRPEVLEALRSEGFQVKSILDFSPEEANGIYLEGTGSLVLDRSARIAYLAVSERSSAELAARWAGEMGYTLVVFHAFHRVGDADFPVYHTNVMLAAGNTLNILCEAAIRDEAERKRVTQSLLQTGRPLVTIDEGQMNAFAGNMIELCDRQGRNILFMSSTACNALRPAQLDRLNSLIAVVDVPLAVIEAEGGGSLRCMIAEIFLPRR